MEIRKMQYGVALFILTVALSILYSHPLHAADELRLIGMVKSVDHVRRTIVVDVQTERCEGTRKFSVDAPAEFDEAVGKRIDFIIDSSSCGDGEVYNIKTFIISGGTQK